MADEFTYDELFAFLREIGFLDSSSSDFERVFEHPGSGIILAFAMLGDPSTDRPVRSADVLSAEFHLQQRGLLVGRIQDAIPIAREANG